MPDSGEKRIKFCRYCDGVIEWGTKVCPHCGESLEVLGFDDLDFVSPGVREVPPRRSKKDIPVAKPLEAPPQSQPTEGPPVVKPMGTPPAAKPIRNAPARLSGKVPVVKPIGGAPGKGPARKPPVVKPIGKPSSSRAGGKLPVAKPISPRAPEKRRGRAAPPPIRPARTRGAGDLPVAKPLPPSSPPPAGGGSGGPPVIQPMEAGGGSASSEPGTPSEPIAECPVCDVEMESAHDVGAVCTSCEEKVCLPCLLRANGIRASASAKTNRARWNAHLEKTSIDQIRCPACGQKGMSRDA